MYFYLIDEISLKANKTPKCIRNCLQAALGHFPSYAPEKIPSINL